MHLTISPLFRNHLHSQIGASFIEFNIVAIPLILVGLFGVELMLFNQSRMIVSYALNEAMRAAITQHAEPSVTEATFAKALLPLFAPAGRHADIEARQLWEKKKHLSDTGLPQWKLNKLFPNKQDFDDFAHPVLSRRNGRPTIRNNYLKEQHREMLQIGWPDGKGPMSQRNVFEANSITLQVIYLKKPLTPGVSTIIKLLLSSQDKYIESAYRQGLLVIVTEQQALMHSDPMLW